MRYLLAPDNTLIVRGPASVRLLNGEASVLGAPLGSNANMIVRREKQLPIEARSETDLEITIGGQGTLFEIQGSTIPTSWKSAAEALVDIRQGRVMIIGTTDVGKSTLSTYLTNSLLSQKIAITMVDGDVGQADIGPPTTIGRAVPTGYVSSLVDLKPEELVFIGHITPSPVEAKLIAGVDRLLGSETQSLTIINTDGWVLDPEAITYKIKMIEAIKPDIVLGISVGDEIQSILSGSRARSLSVEAPQNILVRSRSDRREIRTAGYRRFLEGGKTRTYSLHDIALRLPDGIKRSNMQKDTALRSLIVGMLDERSFLVQIGVLLELGAHSLQAYSRPAISVRTIEVGCVRLSTDGVEIGYIGL